RARVLVRVAPRARQTGVVPAAGALQPAAALGRRGARLDRRRVRPPAVGDRRRAADGARRLVGLGRASRDQPGRLRRVLHGAAGRRRHHDEEIHRARARRPRHVAQQAGDAAVDGDGRLTGGPMLDYETLRIIWWLLLGVVIAGFAMTDGYDLGALIFLRVLPRDDDERIALIQTFEPMWEGH